MKTLLTIFFSVFLSLTTVSCVTVPENAGQRHDAQEYQAPPPSGGPQIQGQPTQRRMPPREVSDACNGKNQEDACEFNAPHGMVTGICRMVQNQLSCTPKGAPGRERQQPGEFQMPPPEGGPQVQGQQPQRRVPPKEVSDACIGKNQEDACVFNAPSGTATGICRMVQNQLACTPKGAPGKGRQQPGEFQAPPPEGGPQVPGQQPQRRMAPKEIVDACVGKKQDDACEFIAPHGTVTGICRTMHNQLTCAPKGTPGRERQQP